MLENMSFWLLEYITVGLSEDANMTSLPFDLKGVRWTGRVPRETLLRMDRT
jgi:hypothetical protein